MNCTDCQSPTLPSANGMYARCTSCARIYLVHEGALRAFDMPAGIDPALFASGLGFPGGPAMPPTPMEATKRAFEERAKEKVAAGGYMDVGGVRIRANADGLSANTDTLKKELKKDAEGMVSGWIWSCVFGLVFLVLVGGIVVCAGGAIGWSLLSTSPGSSLGAVESVEWDGTSPYSCGAAQKVTLSGARAILAGKTAISAGGNCQLTLDGLDVEGAIAVEASGNASVVIVGGSLKGSTSAIKASGNASVDVQGASVTGKVAKSGNAKVTGI